jgi:hypothetical protein
MAAALLPLLLSCQWRHPPPLLLLLLVCWRKSLLLRKAVAWMGRHLSRQGTVLGMPQSQVVLFLL